MSELTKILKSIWGYDNFRPLQREVIDSVNAGADTVALMPTGGGKSLTYQVPTMAKDGICIVITPLIALMKDQVDSLRKRGILAAGVHSGMSLQKIENTLDNCLWGDYKFLYIAPERISSPVFLSRFAEMEVSLIAVDEAHCISEWGYDFRPTYLKINSLRELKPEVPILALTASATPKVLDEIVNHLKLRTPQIHRMSFRRNNLSYVVRQTEDKQSMLRHILQNVSGSAIVYVRSRK
ncbi:MAG: RecQ family ATP-dependent DNA helicase, partial [Rikenellaceae bacterium]|nr:RecQ family ATP-dependent DNA helicase [Rikenellaceae bacterium]